MKNQELNTFLHVLAAFVAGMFTIAASAGAMNYGVCEDHSAFYVVAGLINLLGWGGALVWQTIKYIKAQRTASASTGAGTASTPASHSDNKTDEVKDNDKK